ncbi:MAG TPA: methyltransferase domain-containing protein [Solirubrobacterales bacterium]|nr:methyltransferase domain-containing protein [Solirubrobacterales bacterium]
MAGTIREWDATAYQRVSVPHEEWARAVVDRLALQGGETVLDAGCGTGRLTRMLIERLPRGRVIGIDGSRAMVEKVGKILRPRDEARSGDLTKLELGDRVDAIGSSAVFHWILDHDALFSRMHACLKPGGRLAAQCGGAGNIDKLRQTSREVAAREPYADHLRGLAEPWNYAGAEETEGRLRDAGFEAVRCWLQPWEVVPPEPFEFLRVICLAPYLDPLPSELHDPFIRAVLAAEGEPLRLGYVRLNIDAQAPL